MSSAERDLKAEIFARRLQLLYRSLPAVLGANVLFSPLAAWAFREQAGAGLWALWLGLQALLVLARLWFWKAQTGHPVAQAPLWARRFAWLTTLAGLAWAPVGWCFLQLPASPLQVLLALAVGALLAAALSSLAAYPPAYWGFGLGGGGLAYGLQALRLEPPAALASLAACAVVFAGHWLFCRRYWRVWDEAEGLRLREQGLRAQSQRDQQQLARAGQVKQRFLAALSHDLRHPLFALELHLGSLRSRRPEWRRALRPVEASVASLSAAFNSLLELARLEDEATPPPRFSRVPLAPLFDSLALSLSAAYQRQGARLEHEARALTVWADPLLLERLLRNLLDNAARHGGRRVSLRAAQSAGKIRIQVEDDGPGLPRGGGPVVTRDAGLGLKVVAQLAKALGAKLQLSRPSAKRRGTRILLIFSSSP